MYHSDLLFIHENMHFLMHFFPFMGIGNDFWEFYACFLEKKSTTNLRQAYKPTSQYLY